MRWLLERIAMLLARIFGRTPQAAPQAMTCIHPEKAQTACTWQATPKGKWGWYYRCRACGAWLSC